MMKKIIVVVVVALAVLAGCASPAPTSSSTSDAKVTFGLTYIPDVQFAPVYVAKEKGFFADAGVDVTLRHHGAQEALFGALAAGQEDVVFAGASEMLVARSVGTDVVNFATLYQKYPVVVIVGKDSPITRLEDLNGKTIGMPGNYGENYFAYLALKARGIDAKAEFIGYTQTAALSSGKVDAVLGYANNDAVSMEHAGFPVRTISLGDLPLISVGLGSLAGKVPAETQKALVTALEKGAEFAAESPEETLDITAKYVTALVDPAQRENAKNVLAETMKFYNGGAFGSQDPQKWSDMVAFLEKSGVLKKPVDAKATFAQVK
ncbi:NitT/TauT family transport system substrate-binding protein [Arcanobacterium wilhelmae]|uniref:NitT/TauT family transport system substrate-binding protein n=1 Tax=Arcanobacterium wilhelmae TaxID=1803177 RepID=A0ABT9N8J2_9ACTO|nr:ABC transporter substrate-binding protein [Arcanobacterium wilhelmae]MDP9800022.1 NitT/TauT family transport system substrate-binding protein [Arcanobacterium wilhelmae]WFN89519.1 ABC transporter substrate-binding protein [Arcanobacterium wilhelmae]